MDASLGRSARVRFMLDTIYAVKNNRKTKGVLDDQDEKVAPLRKWVRGLVRKSSSTSVSTGFKLRVGPCPDFSVAFFLSLTWPQRRTPGAAG